MKRNKRKTQNLIVQHQVLYEKCNRGFQVPSYIIINILLRLPIPTIIHCKCVCKSWLNLLDSHEFINYHISKSIPGLAFLKKGYDEPSKLYKIYNFNDDEHDLLHHELHYDLVTSFELPFPGTIMGSANGLLLYWDYCNGLFVCNPITREYIKIDINPHPTVTFGFGASRIKGQHKVVRIFHEETSDKLLQTECQVYTLGSGTWRSITPPAAPLTCTCFYKGGYVFCNGNLHWLQFDSRGGWISCFDLETELFSVLSLPDHYEHRSVSDVCPLGNFLGLCDMLFEEYDDDHEIAIWLMKEYGVEKSWTKEFVIRLKSIADDLANVEYTYPIKVFKDGDILIAWGNYSLIYFSSKTRTCGIIDMFEPPTYGRIESILHTSSFISLKSFPTEKVFSF